MSQIYQHQFTNGLWLVAELIEHAESLAMTIQVPAGVVAEPEDQQGIASLLAEMICRGAGDLAARAHSDALDRLGVQRSTEVETNHLRLSAVMIGTKLTDALPLLTDMVRRPMLAESTLAPIRDLALQALDALEDEPQQKVFLELKRRHLPQPMARSPLGQRSHIEAVSLDQLRQFWQAAFVPSVVETSEKSGSANAVIGFAGKFEWERLKDQVEHGLGDWSGQIKAARETTPAPRGYDHQKAQTTQVHIGLMYDAVSECDERSMLQRAATWVLSGGMSGRLFTEVREKRGLCYSVYAVYAGQRDRGAVVSYAGTSKARAQETLDVMRSEHKRLSEGVEADECERALVGMKSGLVMQGESSGARARAITVDQYIYGRPRGLDEVEKEVEAVSLDLLRQFVADNPPPPMTIVTVGPQALKA